VAPIASGTREDALAIRTRVGLEIFIVTGRPSRTLPEGEGLGVPVVWY
jgi:hypothetical protein